MHSIEPQAALASERLLEECRSMSDLERITTQALHVLSDQGLFALGLFLATRKRDQDKAPAEAIHRQIVELLADLELGERPGNRDAIDLAYYRSLTETLQNLLLSRQVIETLLIYARHGAKAAQHSGESRR